MLSSPVPRLPTEPVPLTYSQQWTWGALDLARNPSSRSVVVASRLSGRLDIDSLRRSCEALLRRHEALRTTIVVVDDSPWQRIELNQDLSFEIFDLRAVPILSREAQAKGLAEELVREPVDISVGPLFAVRLLRLRDDESVFVAAMDHMISDGFSAGVLLRDLWTMYVQSVRGEPISVLPLRVQFADYAVWQKKGQHSWIARHGQYWRGRLAGAAAAEIFAREMSASEVKMASVPVRVARSATNRLREMARREGTTLVLAALAVYAALLLRRSGRSDVVIYFVSMGRSYPCLRNTIGYFGASLLLRIEILAGDDFLHLLRRVTRDYAAAEAHADFGFLAAQPDNAELASSPRFNWYAGQSQTSSVDIHDPMSADEAGLRYSGFEIQPRTDVDARRGGMELMIAETDERIDGQLWYRADCFPSSALAQFALSFGSLIEAVTDSPRVALSPAPS